MVTASSVLSFAFVGIQAVAGHAEGPSSAAASSSTPANSSVAQDENTATAIATTYDHPVTVTDDTTPTDQVTANSDGTLTLSASAEPVRVEQDGSWTPTDLTLISSSGWVVPTATAAPVRFSAGGSSIMAEVETDGGDWLAESWPGGTLPAPSLDGDTAVYENVLPGVDLRLTATATGMAEVLVVQTATAAANPALADLELKMPNATVSVNSTDSTIATAPDATSVQSAPPTWWDSSQPGADASGPGGAGEPQPLPHTTDGDSVNLDVGAVAGQAPQYPIYVDPDWHAGQQEFWFTDRAYPNQSYLNGNQSAGYQSVGWANQGGITYLSRAFWQFGVSALAGKHILGATMNITVSYSCASTPIQLWTYGGSTPSFTWNTDPGKWDSDLSSATPTSASGCAVSQSLGMTATSGVATAAANSNSTMQLGIRATDESGDVTSRKHLAQDATLEVQYESTPNTPSNTVITLPSRSCGSSESTAAWVNNAVQPITFQTNQSSPDSGNLTTVFELANDSSLSTPAFSFSASGAQGAISAQIPKGRLGSGDFAVRAKTEPTDGSLSSAWTGWCYIHVQNFAPPAPTSITVDTTNATVGQFATLSAHVSVSDSSVRGFVIWARDYEGQYNPQSPVSDVTTSTGYHTCNPTPSAVNSQVNWAAYTCAALDSGSTTNYTGSANFTVSSRTTSIYAATLDRAGNISTITSGSLSSNQDGTVALSAGHAWLGDGTDTSSIPDLNTNGGTGLTAGTKLNLGTAISPLPAVNPDGSIAAGPANGPQTGTVMSFSGTTPSATAATTSSPVIDQTKSFNVSAWLKPSSTASSSPTTGVAEGGASGSAFALQQVATHWQFCLTSQTTNSTQCVSTAAGTATAGAWRFVTGIWDVSSATTGQLSIVLDGDVEDGGLTVTAPRPPVSGDTAATGPLIVGASSITNSQPWLGNILDVAVFPGVPDSGQLDGIEGYGDPNG